MTKKADFGGDSDHDLPIFSPTCDHLHIEILLLAQIIVLATMGTSYRDKYEI